MLTPPKNSPSQVGLRFEQVRTSRLRLGLTCIHYPYYTLFIFKSGDSESLLQDLDFSKSERNKQIFVTFTPEDNDVDKNQPGVPVVVCIGVRRVYKPYEGPQGQIMYIFNNDSQLDRPTLGARHMNADRQIDGHTVTVTINLGLDFRTRTPAIRELYEKPPADGVKDQYAEADMSSCLKRIFRVSYIEHHPKRQTPRCQQCQMDGRKCLTRQVGRHNRCAHCCWMHARCYAADEEDENQMNVDGVGKDDDEPGEDKNKLMKKVLQPSGIYLCGKKARRRRKKSLSLGSPGKKTSDNNAAKSAKGPKPRVSEGGSFAQPGDLEGIEDHGGIFGLSNDACDGTASEVDSDDSLIFSSKPKFRTSGSKELSDSDKFQGNKGPAMPYTASQEDQAMGSQPMSSQPVMSRSQSPLDPQNLSFNTFVTRSTRTPANMALEEYMARETSTTIMPGAQIEDTVAGSVQTKTSPEDTQMGFDGAGDTPSRA